MKKCPFCAEQIQDDAVKCRFCGEFLDRSAKLKAKWYFATSVSVIAILCLGPLALPLVWFNPRYKPITKIIVTVLVTAITILFVYLAVRLYVALTQQIELLTARAVGNIVWHYTPRLRTLLLPGQVLQNALLATHR